MTSFPHLGLPEHLLTAVAELGFTTPTPIQEQAIPQLMAGRDVIGVAQTGTGKTAAFALPLLSTIDPAAKYVQGLILAPTRELAMQVAAATADFARQESEISVVAVYGGSAYDPQIKALKNGAQVVVGTPGRVMDLMRSGVLDISQVHFFVLDEADEMLQLGFAEDVETIAAQLPSPRRSALFSATMPPAIRKIANTYLTDPAQVTVSAEPVATIEQTYAVVPTRHKAGALARVLAVSNADAALVFVRTRLGAEELAIELSTRGVQAAALSGDVQQKDREKLVSRLRTGSLDVLVATDVAARGLDVDRIELVVNYDVPREVDTYVHRIGRTGRAGRAGRALTFVTPKEHSRLRRIEKVTKKQLTQVDIPTAAQVSQQRAVALLKTAAARIPHGNLTAYHDAIAEFEELAAHLVPERDLPELVPALLAVALRDTGQDDEPEKLTAKFDGDKKSGRGRIRANGGATYRVAVGKRDGVSPGAIVGAITGEGGLSGSQLGRINIFPSFSLVEIDSDLDRHTLQKLSRARVAGRALNIRKDTGPRANKKDQLPQSQKLARRGRRPNR
ncbi:MAG: DEAD/DEAH box helicase [Trueperella sp.]|nr:DEAD/DEAH box helicase [Trueperella sp.]